MFLVLLLHGGALLGLEVLHDHPDGLLQLGGLDGQRAPNGRGVLGHHDVGHRLLAQQQVVLVPDQRPRSNDAAMLMSCTTNTHKLRVKYSLMCCAARGLPLQSRICTGFSPPAPAHEAQPVLLELLQLHRVGFAGEPFQEHGLADALRTDDLDVDGPLGRARRHRARALLAWSLASSSLSASALISATCVFSSPFSFWRPAKSSRICWYSVESTATLLLRSFASAARLASFSFNSCDVHVTITCGQCHALWTRRRELMSI